MRLLYPAAAVVSAIFLISCQKDFNFTPTDESDTPGPADSVYFSKLYYKEGLDTTSIWTVTYDDRRRVVTFSDTFDISGSDFVAEITFYSYNGIDSLPFKSIKKVVQAGFPDSYDTVFHSYDNSGRLVKDSTIDGGTTLVRKISYAAGKMYGETYTNFGGSVFREVVDTAQIDNNNNIQSSKEYRWNGANYALYANVSFTHDNRPNAFGYLNVKKLLFQFPGLYNSGSLYEQSLGRNNIASAAAIDPFTGVTETETVTYLYNSRSYPAKATVSDNSFQGTAYFSYRAFP